MLQKVEAVLPKTLQIAEESHENKTSAFSGLFPALIR